MTDGIHHILDSNCIRISSVLSNFFGKVGRYVLNCLLEGIDIDEIIEGIPVTRIKRRVIRFARLSQAS